MPYDEGNATRGEVAPWQSNVSFGAAAVDETVEVMSGVGGGGRANRTTRTVDYLSVIDNMEPTVAGETNQRLLELMSRGQFGLGGSASVVNGHESDADGNEEEGEENDDDENDDVLTTLAAANGEETEVKQVRKDVKRELGEGVSAPMAMAAAKQKRKRARHKVKRAGDRRVVYKRKSEVARTKQRVGGRFVPKNFLQQNPEHQGPYISAARRAAASSTTENDNFSQVHGQDLIETVPSSLKRDD